MTIEKNHTTFLGINLEFSENSLKLSQKQIVHKCRMFDVKQIFTLSVVGKQHPSNLERENVDFLF